MSKMRNIAAILGRTEAANVDNSPGVDLDDNVADSSVVSSILAGSAMAMYINGISVATATNSSSFSNTARTIGARYTQDQQYYFGYLQDLRITNGLARYTANFTPPTAEFNA
jgi:hypothetical protein